LSNEYGAAELLESHFGVTCLPRSISAKMHEEKFEALFIGDPA
jgi:hypothetical protein